MYSTNGLQDHPEIRMALIKDAQLLLNAAMADSGHLGDIIGGIRTIQASMEIKAKKLSEIFKDQKGATT